MEDELNKPFSREFHILNYGLFYSYWEQCYKDKYNEKTISAYAGVSVTIGQYDISCILNSLNHILSSHVMHCIDNKNKELSFNDIINHVKENKSASGGIIMDIYTYIKYYCKQTHGRDIDQHVVTYTVNGILDDFTEYYLKFVNLYNCNDSHYKKEFSELKLCYIILSDENIKIKKELNYYKEISIAIAKAQAVLDSTMELYNLLEQKSKKKSRWLCCFN